MFKARFPKRFALPMILGLFAMYSCSEKDYYDPNYGGGKKDNPLDIEVPADMDWNLLGTANITVDVNDDEYSDEFYYKVEILDNNPFEGKTYQIVDAGAAKKGQPFIAKVEYVKGKQNTFYIRKTSPVGRVSVQPYTIAKEEVTPVSRSAVSNINYQTKDASSFNYDTTGAIELTDLNTVLQSNKKYIISGELTGIFKLYDLNHGNATVFIKGKWEKKGEQNLQNVDIVVLKSGEVKGDKIVVADKATLTILPGGEVEAKHVEAQGNGIIENYGEIDADQFIVNNSNSTIYNKADAKIEGDIIKFTGGNLQNDGTIDFDKFSPDGGDGTFINNCEAFFDNEESEVCEMKGSVKVILNKGVIAKDYENGKYEPIKKFICSGNCSITMNGGSMIKAKKATIKGSGSITSDGKHNLLKIAETLELSGAPTLRGELTVECSKLELKNYLTLPNGIIQYEPGKSPVIISTCKEEELPDDNPNPPTNLFPIEITTSRDYIFAMEDQWPFYGDYDMNDVVVGVSPQITNYVDTNETKVKQIKFNVRLLAVGALKQIAAAIQLDKITPDQVESVDYNKRTELLGSSFNLNGNGLEAGQDKAVIPFFENANKLLGGNFVNVGREDKTDPVEFTIAVNFKDNANVKPEDLGHQDLNFFIIPDLIKLVSNTRRPEVHLGGYTSTKHANPDLFDESNENAKRYIGKDYMVWGLMIPTSEWECPDENVSIKVAYPNFAKWVTTGGKENSDWYERKE